MSPQPHSTLRIALGQLNPTVGDLAGNAAKAIAALARARDLSADLLVLPELFVTGYPPEDLVRKPAFAAAARATTEDLARATVGGPALLVGTVWPEDGKVYNSVALLEAGRVAAIRHKVDLPNYGVFDEKRVFDAGPLPGPILFKGVKIGAPICEDIWTPDVVECLTECGAEIILSPNGSPFDWPKMDQRMNVLAARRAESGIPIVYLNQVGGQDELVFDGASVVLNGDGSLAVQLPAWVETIALTTWTKGDAGWRCEPGEQALVPEGPAAAYHAAMVGLRDYVDKNGFPGVVLGLSGGVDSALVAALAADALGAARVHAVMLPYRYTSSESLNDAEDCAKRLGVRYDVVPIAAPVEGMMSALQPLFLGSAEGVAEENIQSRVRGTLLMALSNKFGSMVLTTGNKSEMSVGYATLYGDMNGGFNPIKDLYKMEVYALCRWRNSEVPAGGKAPQGEVIPDRILTKAPSAELRPDQTDQDSLPPYADLDAILRGFVEEERSVAEIVAAGQPEERVRKIERLLYLAEYKRRQSAPGVKVSARNFGRDRRYPITNRFREGHLTVAQQPSPGAPKTLRPRADGGDVG